MPTISLSYYPQEATQLMEKQGACFADRPHSVAGSDIHAVHATERVRPTTTFRKRVAKSSRSLAFFSLIFNPLHRVAHCRFQPKATLGYDVGQTACARNIVMDLLDDPESHPLHVQTVSSIDKVGRTRDRSPSTLSQFLRLRDAARHLQQNHAGLVDAGPPPTCSA